MNTPESQRIILIAGTITVGSTVIGRSLPKDQGGKGDLPTIRMFVGTLVAFTGISIISEFAPEVAAGLAASVAGTAFVLYGSKPFTQYFQPISQPKVK